MTSLKTTLLVLTFTTLQFFASRAAALPLVTGANHHTDRFAPHSIPGWPLGDFVQIGAVLNTSDPPGSPTIVVNVKQGETTLTLDWYSLPNTIYPTPHLYYKFTDFDPALTGSWEIIPTDSTGVGASGFTYAIAEPEFLPVPEVITVQGTPLGASVKWTVPDLTGFDVEYAQVRVVQVTPLAEIFISDLLPLQTTSLQVPLGVLQVGVDYVYQVALQDFEGFIPENRSSALSEPFRFTIPGDFNMDATVDTADYVVWRKNHSGDQAAYDAWRTHFGTSLGPGSGSALPSADPLSAAVPEPANIVMLSTVLVTLSFRSRRRSVSK